MQQPQARERYLKRQGMVEPVFSHLRYQQGLNRFRRNGLRGVRLEFSLHAMAYNLSRAWAMSVLLRLDGYHKPLKRHISILIYQLQKQQAGIAAPAMTGVLAEHSGGSYTQGLYLAAFAMLFGTIFVLALKRLESAQA